jgi:SAM-dependent MidA family methyltransferase
MIAPERSVPFSTFMEAALYGDEGFYTRGGGAGRRRDFVTSPEVGALFGAVIANALDSWWDEAGRPVPFVVIEPGAGPGTLGATALRANPRCAHALWWVMADRSVAMRDAQRERNLPWTDIESIDAHAPGPLVSTMTDFPAELKRLPISTEVHVVLANELLDNLVFDIASFDGEQWCEVQVTSSNRGFSEVTVRADDSFSQRCDSLVGSPARTGVRIPVLVGAQQWLRDCLAAVPSARIVAFDYGTQTTAELVDRHGGWLRVYRGHQKFDSPYDAPGFTDITTDVVVDQLASVRSPTKVRTQAAFLLDHDIAAIVDEALVRAQSFEPNSLAALRLQSFSHEQQTLLDTDTLGGFLVIEWLPGERVS